MSIDPRGPGRLCNGFIRNAFASMLARAHDLSVVYEQHSVELGRLGIDLYSGMQTLPGPPISVTDSEVLLALEGKGPCPGGGKAISLDNSFCYFQSRECTKRLRDWLHPQKATLRTVNPYAARIDANEDIFIHIRLGDVIKHNPGIEYYRMAIKRTGCSAGYIGTDSPDHPMIAELIAEFPQLRLFNTDPVSVILFASTCRHVVLSHGSFSAVIGMLSFSSTVYYPPYNVMWHGDMFTQPDWVLVV